MMSSYGFKKEYDPKKQEADEKRKELRQKLGSWIFAMMSTFNKEEFIHLAKNMTSDLALAKFRKLAEDARQMYTSLCELCTPRQTPYIGKPFFYSIRHSESIDMGEGEELASKLFFELDNFTTKQSLVTAKLRTAAEFGAFGNCISNFLQAGGGGARQKIESMVDEDMQIALAALSTQQPRIDAELAQKQANLLRYQLAQEEKKRVEVEEEDKRVSSDLDEDNKSSDTDSDMLVLECTAGGGGSGSGGGNERRRLKQARRDKEEPTKKSIFKEAALAKVSEVLQAGGMSLNDKKLQEAGRRVAEAIEKATVGNRKRK